MKKEDAEVMAGWKRSPGKFIEDVFGLGMPKLKAGYQIGINTELEDIKADWFEPFVKGKQITWQQWVVVLAVERAVAGGKRFISVSSGRGIGKSCIMAIILLWFLICHKDAQIPCTAPGAQQMYDVLWKEVAKWHDKLPENFKNLIEVGATYIRVKERPLSWFARAATARKEKPEALSGIHSDDVMLLVDEACFDEQTEILTEDGFKFIKDLGGERVLAMGEDGEAKFEEVEHKHKYEGEREMYFYKGRGCNFAVTSNHRMVYRTRKSMNLRLKEIKELDKSGNVSFPRKVEYQGRGGESYVVAGYASARKVFKELEFKMEDWVKLVAWYLAEGSIDKNNYLIISQYEGVNAEKCREIEGLLNRMGIKYTQYKSTDYHIRYPQISVELKKYGTGFLNKRIPRYIKHSQYADVFLDTFVKGDGYVRGERRIFYTSSTGMADDLQEMLYLTGSAGTKNERKKERKKFYKDHYIQSLSPSFCVYERRPTDIKYRGRNVRTETFKGPVYCVTVPSGRIFVRRGGQCLWTGNSGVPDEVFEIGIGSLTNKNAIVLMISNYTRNTGYFHRSQLNKYGDFQVLSFSAVDSPIVERDAVDRALREGEDSNEYRVNICGMPPKIDEEIKGYIPLLREADLRFTSMNELVQPIVLGIDPSGQGRNKTVIVARDPFRAVCMGRWDDLKPVQIMQKTSEIIEALKVNPDNVFLDAFGVGAEVMSEFMRARRFINGVMVGNPATDHQRFINLKAEMSWRAREWLVKGGELTGTYEDWEEVLGIRYFSEVSKIKIMGKRAMVAAGLKSPDLWDALVLTFTREFYEVPDENTEIPEAFDPFSIL